MIYAFASNFVLVWYLMGPAYSIPTTWKGVALYILTLDRFPVGGFIIVTALDEPRVELLKPRYPVLLSGFRHGQPHSPWWVSMRAFSTGFSVKTSFLVGKLGNPPGFYLCTGKSLLISLQFSCSWSFLNCFFASGLYPFHPKLDLFASLFYGERFRDLLYFSGCFWCCA